MENIEKLIEESESLIIWDEPNIITQEDDGMRREVYENNSIEFENKTYMYDIEWKGKNDCEDEGTWSEPYNIKPLKD